MKLSYKFAAKDPECEAESGMGHQKAAFALPRMGVTFPSSKKLVLSVPWMSEVKLQMGFVGSNLQDVSLDRCTGLSFAVLSGLSELSMLGALSLQQTDLDDAGMEALEGLPLTSLNLGQCNGISAEGLGALHGMPLKTLNLCLCCGFAESGLSALVGLPLTKLDLSCLEDKVTDVGLLLLSQLRHLNSLDLSGSLNDSFTPDGIGSLRKLPLTALGLSVNMDEDGFLIKDSHVQELWDLPLVELVLGDSGITDEGIRCLKRMPIRKLNLEYCDFFSGEGFEVLKGMPLTTLNLKLCPGLTLAGLKALKHFPLVSLDLEGCEQINDSWVSVLEKFRSLRFIDLSDTNVSEVAVKIVGGKGVQVKATHVKLSHSDLPLLIFCLAASIMCSLFYNL